MYISRLYLVVIIVYIEEVGAFIATLCKYAWSNCRKEDGITCFHNKLHAATATVNISYANDVAGVWDLNLYVYR